MHVLVGLAGRIAAFRQAGLRHPGIVYGAFLIVANKLRLENGNGKLALLQRRGMRAFEEDRALS
jgi:hypothetical protein